MRGFVRVAVAALVLAGGAAGSGAAAGCAPPGDDTYLHDDGSEVGRALPTVYTDGLATHAGVCTDDVRVQVNDVQHFLAGGDLVTVETG